MTLPPALHTNPAADPSAAVAAAASAAASATGAFVTARSVAGIGGGDERVCWPVVEGHVLQQEGQKAQGVLWVFFREGFHIRVAVERSP